jgi:predicted PurR-regulated permease PerM
VPAKRFLFTVLVVGIALSAASFFPLIGALLLAAAFAAMFWPWNMKLAKRLGKKRGRTAAAGLLTAGVLVVILGPVVALSAFLVKEVNEGARFISETLRSEGVHGLIERLPDSLEKVAQKAVEQLAGEVGEDESKLNKKLTEQVAAQSGKAAGVVSAVVGATGTLLFQGAMMLIAFYFLLREGEQLAQWLDRNAPLPKGQTLELMNAVRQVTSSVIKSTLITSAIQAIAALAGYLIARVPYPAFFTALTFVIAFIPAVGAGSVCLAAAGIILVTGHPYMALFLAIWALTVVALIDNVAKPFLIKDDVPLHGAIVFFALLGGLAMFGAIGLLVGPLAVALMLEALRMYRRDFMERV